MSLLLLNSGQSSAVQIPYAANYIAAATLAGASFSGSEIAIINTYFDEMQGRGVINTTYNFLKNGTRLFLYLGGSGAPHLICGITAISFGSFNGGGTNNTNGYLGNATNAYQNTALLDSDLNSNSIGVYIRVGNNYTTGLQKQLFYGGNGTGTTGLGLLINYPFSFNMTYATASTRKSGVAAVPNTKGSYSLRRLNTTMYLDKDGLNLDTAMGYSYSPNGVPISVNSANYAGTQVDYSDALIQNLYFGKYFNQAQSVMIDAICANLQSGFSRL